MSALRLLLPLTLTSTSVIRARAAPHVYFVMCLTLRQSALTGRPWQLLCVAAPPTTQCLTCPLPFAACSYSALLRLPEDTKPLDLQFRIESVLEELGLQHVAESQVG